MTVVKKGVLPWLVAAGNGEEIDLVSPYLGLLHLRPQRLLSDYRGNEEVEDLTAPMIDAQLRLAKLPKIDSPSARNKLS
jgi:hypothetical protein